MKHSDQAVENHKQFMSCSAAVLRAFSADAGLSEQAAAQLAAPMAGGRMGTCGAVRAAQEVLIRKYGENDPRAAELERRFREKNRSSQCREIKGGLDGTVLRSCRGCVEDAAALLEELLNA